MIDRLLVDGAVVTMDPHHPTAAAIAIRKGRIAAVGGTEELMRERDRSTEVVDLGGRCVVPGFVDAHSHFALTALDPVCVDVGPAHASDISEVQARIAAAASVTPAGRWIRGVGHLVHGTREGRRPTRWELDEAAPGHPTVVIDAGVHRVVANSLALAAAGIVKGFGHVPCGVVDRHPDGEPTGTLAEAATNDVHRRSIEDLTDRYRADVVALIEANARRHLALGVTAVHDAWVTPRWDALMRRTAAAGRLPMYYLPLRGAAEGPFAAPTAWVHADPAALAGHGRIRRGGIKLFADGAGPTAATRSARPAGDADAGDGGILFFAQAELDALVTRALRRDLVVAVHAMGGRAIDAALTAAAGGRAAAPGSSSRLRIEHFAAATAGDVARAARLDVGVVVQPVGVWQYGDVLAPPHRADELPPSPVAQLLAGRVGVAASSDAPCFDPAPLLSIEAMVERRTQAGRPLAPEQAVTIEEALAAWTMGGARAGGTEDVEGSISVGKIANLVVLAVDPRAPGTTRLRDIAVDETWIDGTRVHRRAA